MSVTAKTLISAKYAGSSATTEYTAPSLTYTVIDKLTATNTDGSARTVSVYLVASGGTASDANVIIKDKSIDTLATYDFSEIKNHILDPGSFISVVASVASKVVIRASGREIT